MKVQNIPNLQLVVSVGLIRLKILVPYVKMVVLNAMPQVMFVLNMEKMKIALILCSKKANSILNHGK
jgi:hypothetical protein